MRANQRHLILAGAIVIAAAVYALMQRHEVLPGGGVLDRWTGNITHFIDLRAERAKAPAGSTPPAAPKPSATPG